MDMNLHENLGNQFTNYNDIAVEINKEEYITNIIVTNHEVIPITVNTVANLTIEQLPATLLNQIDLVILGSGNTIKYPSMDFIQALTQKNIGIEVMPIQALCRTFNFLVSENRLVLAILIFDNEPKS